MDRFLERLFRLPLARYWRNSYDVLRLCDTCTGIQLDCQHQLSSQRHHRSFATLVSSVAGGCGLCALFLDTLVDTCCMEQNISYHQAQDLHWSLDRSLKDPGLTLFATGEHITPRSSDAQGLVWGAAGLMILRLGYKNSGSPSGLVPTPRLASHKQFPKGETVTANHIYIMVIRKQRSNTS